MSKWMQGKYNRLLADLKQIEWHLNNLAQIDDQCGVRYHEAAVKLNTAMYNVKRSQTLYARLRRYVSMMNTLDEPVAAYTYAARLVNDVIEEYTR